MSRLRDDLDYCRAVLPKVSRTFALAIRVLPPALNRPVLIAYLLCRIADTLEDDTSIPKAKRARLLQQLGRWVDPAADASGSDLARMDGELADLAKASRIADRDTEMAEGWRLSGQLSRVLKCYQTLSPLQRERIAKCVRDMSEGMVFFISRETSVVEASEDTPRILVGTLSDETELTQYADCVAGTVGRLLQGLFCDHLRLRDGIRRAGLERTATSFGHGLQYTNIIQDLVADRCRGWCYIPESMAGAHGLSVDEILDPDSKEAAVRVVQDLIRRALHHLEGALEFTLLIPRRAPRIRLFCLWPLFLAVATLRRAWGNPTVFHGKIKVGKDEVRRLMRATSIRCFSEGALRRLYARESL